MLRSLVLFLTVLVVSMPALAQEETGETGVVLTPRIEIPEPPLPPKLNEQRLRGAQIYYLGKYDTLDGWAMIREGVPEFYYATPNGRAVVLGLLFSPEGEMMTANQLRAVQEKQAANLPAMVKPPEQPGATRATQSPAQNAPAAAQPQTAAPVVAAAPTQPTVATTPAAPATATTPAPVAQAATPLSAVANTAEVATPGVKLFEAAKAANSMHWGRDNLPAFYAFVDPNCPHCQQFLREVEPYVNAGVISVNMIPMAFTPRSLEQAAYALASSDGAQRMLAYAKGDTAQLAAPEGINTAGVAMNTGVLRDWNLLGTPMIVYRKGGTGAVKLIRGRPLDIAYAVADLQQPN